MVTSTPSENLSLHLYESQNKNFNFGSLKTLILHARSIFFKGGHPTKIWRKKIFLMKTLSKLGALTVNDFNAGKSISRAIGRCGLWKSRLFGPWNGNDRRFQGPPFHMAQVMELPTSECVGIGMVGRGGGGGTKCLWGAGSLWSALISFSKRYYTIG